MKRVHFHLLSSVFVLLVLSLFLRAKSMKQDSESSFSPKTAGDALLVKYECARCHDLGKATLKVSTERSCVSCHQQILSGGYGGKFLSEDLERWRLNLTHIVEVPNLLGAKERLRGDWIERFLLAPHPVRPRLGAHMPRLPLSPAEAHVLASELGATTESSPPLDMERIAHGAKLFEQHNCSRCHSFTGAQESAPRLFAFSETFKETALEQRLAPDLRFTRERMNFSTIIKWLRDPRSVNSDSLMPTFPLSEEERYDLALYLVSTPLGVSQEESEVTFAPISNAVYYPEVEKKILKKICWHCHSNPEKANGDGGPGNTGGFGYKGVSLDLSSYRSVLLGLRGKDGISQNILKKNGQGVPKVIQHLIQRHREVNQGEQTTTLGMPLGLPPLPPEDINLFWGWIEQGAREFPTKQ